METIGSEHKAIGLYLYLRTGDILAYLSLLFMASSISLVVRRALAS